MKIGILTFHHTSNYGAVLQAYALSQFIQSQGHEVEIIDYQPDAANKFYWKAMRFLSRSGPLRIPRFNKDAFHRYWKYHKFQSFFKRYFHLSKVRFSEREALITYNYQYDLVICGSDQIWCLDNPFRGFDPSFFLDFVTSKTGSRTASYAASCGSTNSFGDKKDKISQLINQIGDISVRDANSLRLVQQDCGREATLVLDPTFLGNYQQLIVRHPIRNKYLLLYQHGSLTEAEENLIRHVAHEQNLVIVSVGNHSLLAKYNFVAADPREWLGLFSKAEHIFTNTFHGTIFSLIFRRNFTVLARQSKQNKIQDLLSRFGIEHHILNYDENTTFDIKEHFLSETECHNLSEHINQEVEKSKNFLRKCLASS